MAPAAMRPLCKQQQGWQEMAVEQSALKQLLAADQLLLYSESRRHFNFKVACRLAGNVFVMCGVVSVLYV